MVGAVILTATLFLQYGLWARWADAARFEDSPLLAFGVVPVFGLPLCLLTAREVHRRLNTPEDEDEHP